MSAADRLRIGIICPQCGAGLNSRYVARSYAQAGGHIRTRNCVCGAEVTSFEQVVGEPRQKFMGVVGLAGHDLGVARRIVEALGGKIVST